MEPLDQRGPNEVPDMQVDGLPGGEGAAESGGAGDAGSAAGGATGSAAGSAAGSVAGGSLTVGMTMYEGKQRYPLWDNPKPDPPATDGALGEGLYQGFVSRVPELTIPPHRTTDGLHKSELHPLHDHHHNGPRHLHRGNYQPLLVVDAALPPLSPQSHPSPPRRAGGGSRREVHEQAPVEAPDGDLSEGTIHHIQGADVPAGDGRPTEGARDDHQRGEGEAGEATGRADDAGVGGGGGSQAGDGASGVMMGSGVELLGTRCLVSGVLLREVRGWEYIDRNRDIMILHSISNRATVVVLEAEDVRRGM